METYTKIEPAIDRDAALKLLFEGKIIKGEGSYRRRIHFGCLQSLRGNTPEEAEWVDDPWLTEFMLKDNRIWNEIEKE